MDDAQKNRIAPPVISIIHDTNHSEVTGTAPLVNRSKKLGRRPMESLRILLTEDWTRLDADVDKAIQWGWFTFNVLAYSLAKDEKCFKHLIRYLPDSSITEHQAMKDKLMLCFRVLEQMSSEYPGFPPMHHKEGNEWRKVDVAKSYKDDGAWRFNVDELKSYFKSKGLPWLAEPGTPTAPPVPVKTHAVNFFTREGDSWHIGFEGQDARVKHLTGLSYIGYLLKEQGTPISCRYLYQAASGKTPVKLMSEGAAISEGLNIGSSKQAIGDPKIKAQYISEYMELENDLLKINDLPYEDRTPEDEMQKKEIEKKMAEIMPYLKDRNFADPNDIKAQSNIGKRLNTAYKAIGKQKGMKGMEKYLRDNIETDGNFGLSYTGTLPWEITL